MAICENCGKGYSKSDAEEEYNSTYRVGGIGVIDEMFARDLCFECASEEVESQGDFYTCEDCGKRFDMNFDSSELEAEEGMFLWDRGCFPNCICFECALEAIKNGDFYDECEECGERFHVGEDELRFNSEAEDYGLIDGSLRCLSDKILCADCGLRVAAERYEQYQEEHPDFFEDF